MDHSITPSARYRQQVEVVAYSPKDDGIPQHNVVVAGCGHDTRRRVQLQRAAVLHQSLPRWGCHDGAGGGAFARPATVTPTPWPHTATPTVPLPCVSWHSPCTGLVRGYGRWHSMAFRVTCARHTDWRRAAVLLPTRSSQFSVVGLESRGGMGMGMG